MPSIMVSIELETEVLYATHGKDCIPETVVVHTVCPPAVAAWAKTAALDRFTQKATRGEL